MFLCGGAGATILITEFCPDPYLQDDADEYIVLSGTGLLDGITISDGRGGFRFPEGTRIDGSLVIARSGPAFLESHGFLPDFEWLDYSPDMPDVIRGDALRLANAGDTLMVYENGVLVQSVTWPGDVRPREGQIHYLDEGVWDRRPLMMGQSRFEPVIYHNVTVTVFVSPDASLETFLSAIDSADREILVNIYEFSHPLVTESLVAARDRNVAVTLLAEGGPVGGISQEEKAALNRLNRSGIAVYAMSPQPGGHAPYRYDHAKYMVIDKKAVLVTSENFKFSGFPPKCITGNRGWGVIAEDEGLAGYFRDLFATDVGGPAIQPYAGEPGTMEFPTAGQYAPEFYPQTFTGATVRPVIAPDTSSGISEMIRSATTSIEIEQAYITNESETQLNPYLADAINASRRGVKVRVILDSFWYNTEGPADNDEMVTLINTIARHEGLPLEARLADLSMSGIEKVHNKGVIVDDTRVLVSSINWNSNSPNFNREAGLIIDHPQVAMYFKQVFDDDWAPAVRGRDDSPDVVRIAIVILVIFILFFAWYRRRRW
jgi:phosphatidylserine/phosphatidylglycerophosphate/cardiolipin synthase-like enzyme